ncbi:DUF6611 family protein [Arthrobacter pigmenti]
MTAKMKRPPLGTLTEKGIGFRSSWGRLDTTPPQFAKMLGARDATIFVYPPGTPKRMRSLLALRQLWTTWTGAIIATTLIILAAITGGLWPGTIFALAALTGVWAIVAAATGKTHQRTRYVRARATPSGPAGEVERFEQIAFQLDELDSQPELTAVEHELLWGHIYDQAH